MFSTTITYDTATNFYFDATRVQVTGGSISLLSPYSSTNPIVRTQRQDMLSSLTGFSEVATKPANTSVTYLMYLNSQPYWYNPSTLQWELSDGTVAKSNPASVINTNVGTLVSQSNLPTPVYFSLGVFLNTSDGVSTPVLTSNSFTSQFIQSAGTVISKCVVSMNLQTLLGNVPAYNALYPSQLKIGTDRSFLHSGNMILPFSQTVLFDATGYAQMSIIETQTPGKKLSASVTFYEGSSLKQIKMFPAIIPNQAAAVLTQITDAWNYDFG